MDGNCEWKYRLMCDCGFVLTIYNRHQLPKTLLVFDCCPRCGMESDLMELVKCRWVSTSRFFKPKTWGTGHWERYKKMKLYPIQIQPRSRKPGSANEEVYMRAYEVYCEVYGEQPALIDTEIRHCRGGFGVGELVAFLYAHSFPKNEWRIRVREAFQGLSVD